MKLLKLFKLFFISVFAFLGASAQDPAINVVLGSSGIVNVGGTIFLQVDILNNSVSGNIVVNKVRPAISVPANISTIPATGHNLPAGWTIFSNTGSVIRFTNTTDAIPPGVTRIAFIAIQGTAVGAGSVLANITYNGVPPSGDNTANNISSAGLTVTSAPVPVTLTDFNATLVNCQPVLHWITETEINSDRFEIERGSLNNSGWISIAALAANGNTTLKSSYNFIDKNINASAEKLLYRLKMVDKDGTYKYSNVLPVFINCKTISVHVYPNPVQDGMLYVSLTGTKGNSEATLLSLSGQVIIKKNMNNGTNYLNTLNIADGVYILKIKDANGLNKDVKVFIQK